MKDKIDEELNDLSVVSGYIQFNFDRLDDLKENIGNKIELAQNKIFKLLTVVTFCISLPTPSAGIYGMNFKNMPELTSTYGYPLTLLALLLSVVVPWFILREGNGFRRHVIFYCRTYYKRRKVLVTKHLFFMFFF